MHNTLEEISNQARGTRQISITQLADSALDTSDESKKNSEEALRDLGGEKAFHSKQGADNQKDSKQYSHVPYPKFSRLAWRRHGSAWPQIWEPWNLLGCICTTPGCTDN
jgi:hypothetical protein